MTTNEFERLEEDLEEAYALDTPDLRFTGIAGPRETRTPGAPVRWKLGAALTVLVVAALAGFVVLPGLDDQPKTANAKALIERSIAASEAMASNPPRYHLVAVSSTSTSVITTESWFSDAEHFRNETKSQGADGQTWLEGTAMLGEEFWLWQGSPSQLRAAHGPTSLHIIGIPGIPSLADHIHAWTQDNCFSADLRAPASWPGGALRELSFAALRRHVPTNQSPSRRPLSGSTSRPRWR